MLKAKNRYTFLLIALFAAYCSNQVMAQDPKPDKPSRTEPGGGTAEAGTTSEAPTQSAESIKADKKLKKKENLEDFYRSELRKGTLSDERRADYTENLKILQDEIKEIRAQRLRDAERVKDTDPTILEAEKLNVSFRELDIAIADSAPPMILANEPRSLIFNAGVSFLHLTNYSAPFTISGEKILNENFSVGGYFGHFLEKVVDDKLMLDSNAYFTSNKANYKHTYLNFGLKGSYHYFNPTFILPPTKFDLYATIMLGYTVTTGTHPFLDNEQFLPYDSLGNDVEPGMGENAFLEPVKEGLNFGAFIGLRYMYDRNLGFFTELGYSNTAFATVGVTIRFLDKYTSVGAAGQMVHFKVKILSSERQKKPDSKAFKGRDGIEEYQTKDGYIYVLTGKSTSYDNATDLQVELSGTGFRRAEVVAIKNEEVIKLKKGKKLMGIVEEQPEEVEDPFEKEEEEEEVEEVEEVEEEDEQDDKEEKKKKEKKKKKKDEEEGENEEGEEDDEE